MLRSGVVSITLKEKTAGELIRLAVEAGLEGIEWSENYHINTGDLSAAVRLKRETESAGLKVVSYGSYFRLGTEENFGEIFKKSLFTARELGAPAMRVWAGNKSSVDVSGEEFQRIVRESAVIADMAAELGVKVAYEWHGNTLTDTNESAMKLLGAVNNKNLYCLWQPSAHLDEVGRREGLALLKDKLLNIHTYYWVDKRRYPLEEGEAAWKEYFKLIDGTADHYLLMEFVKDDNGEQFLKDAAVLNNWIREYNQACRS
jgi:sugar phosphate isomerase/epimerase